MDAILELLTAQVESLNKKIDSFGSQPIQNDYNQQQTSNFLNYYHPGVQYRPDFSGNNNSQYQSCNPWMSYPLDFSYPPPPSPVQKSNLENLLDNYTVQNEKAIEQLEMRMNNQEIFAPSLLYTSRFQDQPPPQKEEKQSYLEDVLARFMNATEARVSNQDNLMNQMEMEMTSQAISIQILTNQMEQLGNAIICSPQGTLTRDIEIDSNEDKELCEADSIENGEEFYVADKEIVESSHPNVDEDFEIKKLWIQIGGKERFEEDNQVRDYTGYMQIPIVPLLQCPHPVQEYVECFRIEFTEDNNELEEFHFRGLQSCLHAYQIKEKTKRRHEKTIFAIEPD